MHTDTSGYGLTLADGTQWFLSSDVELRSWLDQFASLFRLKPGRPRGARRLSFWGLNQDESAKAASSDPLTQIAAERDHKGEHWRLWLSWNSTRTWVSSDGGGFAYAFPVADAARADARIGHMWCSLPPVYVQAIAKGGLPLHAALAELGGRGVLFAATGNTGKSTCSRRLPPPWKSWCDDEALVVRDREKNYRAHPFPTWTDYLWRGLNNTWPTEDHVGVSSIFFLEQAEEDAVIPLEQGEAAVRICQSANQIMQIFWPGMERQQRRQATTQLFNNACAMAATIPAFRLRLTLGGRFWVAVEKALPAMSAAPAD